MSFFYKRIFEVWKIAAAKKLLSRPFYDYDLRKHQAWKTLPEHILSWFK